MINYGYFSYYYRLSDFQKNSNSNRVTTYNVQRVNETLKPETETSSFQSEIEIETEIFTERDRDVFQDLTLTHTQELSSVNQPISE